MDYKKKSLTNDSNQNDIYKSKYYKYKSKYLKLKQQGGNLRQKIDDILAGDKNFENFDFQNSFHNLEGKDLTGANFKGVKGTKYLNLNETILDQANFEGAEIPSSGKFSMKSAKGINFENVDFKNDYYNLQGKDFTGANFKGVKGTRFLNLNETILDQANFEGFEIPPSDKFSMKSGKEINFTGVDFRNEYYDFRRVNLTDAIFEGVVNTNYLQK